MPPIRCVECSPRGFARRGFRITLTHSLLLTCLACSADDPRDRARDSPQFRSELGQDETPEDGNGPGSELDFDVDLVCDGQECCPAGMAVIDGTEAADVLASATDGQCIVLGPGADTLDDSGDGTFVLGGAQNDTLTVDGATYVSGGAGADTIIAIGPRTEIHDGAGADTIKTSSDRHIIVPGEGADNVSAGPGSVVVHIRDLCELESGEMLTAGGEDDTLVLPLPEEKLVSLGVMISGFERIVVAGATCRAACAPADCTPEEVML